MNNRKQPKRYVERWLDESYRDREHELVTSIEIARMAGTSASTVTGWRRRYKDFPQPVKEVESGPTPSRYFVAADVTQWLTERWPRGRGEGKARLGAFVADLDAEIHSLREQLRHLESVRDQVRSVIGEADTER